MKMTGILLYLTVLAGSAVVLAQENASSNILMVHGTLTRNGKAGTLWMLEPADKPKFRDESILRVTFTTRVGEDSKAYEAYDGKLVELTGEVKSVFHGNTVLSKVRTIGILEMPAINHQDPAAILVPRPLVPESKSPDRVAYKHAYFLFLASVPKGCEACYVPLLITRHSLEEIAKGGNVEHCVLVITYERDSIWEIKGAIPVDSSAIEAAPRILNVL